MKPPWFSRQCWLRTLAVAAVMLFLGMVVRFWHPIYGFTALLQLDTRNEATAIAAIREYPVYVYRDTGGYDGMQYAQIAHYPLLTASELRPPIDSVSYRGRRILLPALAWVLAAGQPAWIAQIYSSLNIACWLILAALLWRMLPVNDARSLIAWTGILFSAGALCSVRLALIDLPALTLVVAALSAAERGRPRTAVGWLAAAVLTRETSLLAGVGLGTDHWKTPGAVARNLLRIIVAAAPLIAWLIYINWRVGPINQGLRNFSWPVTGLVEKWIECVRILIQPDLPFQEFALTTLLATIGLTVQAGFFLVRPRPDESWWRVGAAYTLLMLGLGQAVWEGFPGAAFRVLLPLHLASNVVAVRTRAPLVWLLAFNLTVFSGLLAFRDAPPRDPREMLLARHWRAAGIVYLGKGWYGQEQNSRHRWKWAESSGHLAIATWPRSEAIETRLTLRLQSLTPRTGRILTAGREIWRGQIGKALTTVSLPLLVTGNVNLELTTDGPSVLESDSPDARRLGFALYDPAISVSERPSAPP